MCIRDSYRALLKHAALHGTAVINNPFWASADDKFFNYALEMCIRDRFTPKSVQTFKERVTLVYRIKIDIDNSNHELKPGMPADARIDLAANKQNANAPANSK